MRKYYEYIKNSFKEQLAYRISFFMGITQKLFGILIQLCVWQALIGQSGITTSSEGVITIEEMTAYVFISSMISTLLNRDIIIDINERVRDGFISVDLIKPMNFTGYMFCRMTGGSLFTLLFQMLPVLAVAVIFIHLKTPALQDMLFFALSLVGAYMIMFFITFILGLLSFWYTSMWQVVALLDTCINLFAGSWIPLWFFPEVFNTISSFLPFRLMYYVPISIYLGKLEYAECWFAVLQQIIWAGILYGITRLVWHAAIKKLVIQGG